MGWSSRLHELKSSLLRRSGVRGTNDEGKRMNVARVQRELAQDIEETAYKRLDTELQGQPAAQVPEGVYRFGVQMHRLVWLNLSPQFVASLPTSAETGDRVSALPRDVRELDEYGGQLAVTAGTALFNKRHNAMEYLLAGHN